MKSDTVYNKYNKSTWLGYNMDARSTFRIIWYCGVAGVLVDLDHIAWAFLSYIFPNAFFNNTGRFLHPSIFIVTCCAICYICAYLGRLYIKYVLRRGEIDKKS